jgi:hypothetical protein
MKSGAIRTSRLGQAKDRSTQGAIRKQLRLQRVNRAPLSHGPDRGKIQQILIARLRVIFRPSLEPSSKK